MPSSFTSQTYNITALLGRSSFPNYTTKKVIIPPFQRSYSWEQTHVSRFWEDIISFHQQLGKNNSQDTYFLGPIVILPEKERILLLDGQQRLATATILLAVIRDIARGRGGQPGADLARDIQRDLILVDDEANIFALTMNELDDPYFNAIIQQDPPNDLFKGKLRSHRLIRQAKNFCFTKVEEFISGLNPKELVVKLKGLRRTIDSLLKIVAIEVLSEEEAFLIFETLNDRGLRLAVPDLVLNYLMRMAKNDEERIRVRESWNSIIENLGPRNISSYLRHMWVSRYGDVKSQGLFSEIRENIATNNIGSLEFTNLLANESNQYVGIVNLDTEVLGIESFPYVEGLVKYIEADRALPLLLSGLVCLNQDDFRKLSHAITTVVIRHSILAGLNPLILENTLYLAARALRNQYALTKNSKMSLKSAKEILQKINPTQEEIKVKLQETYLTRKQAGYIIYAIARKMQTRTNSVELTNNSIEHIFPENAQGEEWQNINEMEQYVWHLGNLTVLEETFNREAGRKGFEEKKKIYSKSEIHMTNKISNDYDKWDSYSILNRSSSFLNIIGEIWPEQL